MHSVLTHTSDKRVSPPPLESSQELSLSNRVNSLSVSGETVPVPTKEVAVSEGWETVVIGQLSTLIHLLFFLNPAAANTDQDQ